MIISTSIACLWLKPIFLGRAAWVWGYMLLSASHLLCLWVSGSETSAKIWDCNTRGIWVQVCLFWSCKSLSWHFCHILGSLTFHQRGRRRFTDLRSHIKWINREWKLKVVININEIFWGIGQDMLHVHPVWAIRSLSAQWIKTNNLNSEARTRSQS